MGYSQAYSFNVDILRNFNFVLVKLCFESSRYLTLSPCKTALNSDWSLNSFMMVVYEKKMFSSDLTTRIQPFQNYSRTSQK